VLDNPTNLSIENEMLKKLEYKNLINNFASQKARRMHYKNFTTLGSFTLRPKKRRKKKASQPFLVWFIDWWINFSPNEQKLPFHDLNASRTVILNHILSFFFHFRFHFTSRPGLYLSYYLNSLITLQNLSFNFNSFLPSFSLWFNTLASRTQLEVLYQRYPSNPTPDYCSWI
jgi:hypothetical protein